MISESLVSARTTGHALQQQDTKRTYKDRLRFIGGVNIGFTESLSSMVVFVGVHVQPMIMFSLGQHVSHRWPQGGVSPASATAFRSSTATSGRPRINVMPHGPDQASKRSDKLTERSRSTIGDLQRELRAKSRLVCGFYVARTTWHLQLLLLLRAPGILGVWMRLRIDPKPATAAQ